VNLAKVYESARAFGVFFARLLRGGVWLVLWLTVGAPYRPQHMSAPAAEWPSTMGRKPCVERLHLRR
jgi:hypothetical protein